MKTLLSQFSKDLQFSKENSPWSSGTEIKKNSAGRRFAKSDAIKANLYKHNLYILLVMDRKNPKVIKVQNEDREFVQNSKQNFDGNKIPRNRIFRIKICS